MRNILILLILMSCVSRHQKPSSLSNQPEPRLCQDNAPIHITFKDNLSNNKVVYEAVTNAMRYWNEEMGSEVFSLVKTREEVLEVSIHSHEEDTKGWIGRTNRNFDPVTKCLISAKVTLKIPALKTFNKKYPGHTESTARHELGHVLGLGHPLLGVMDRCIPSTAKPHPLKLNNEEKILLKKKYQTEFPQ